LVVFAHAVIRGSRCLRRPVSLSAIPKVASARQPKFCQLIGCGVPDVRFTPACSAPKSLGIRKLR
jgi:hypothetical protein